MAPRLNSQQARDVVGLSSELRHVESGCIMYDLTIFDKTALRFKKTILNQTKVCHGVEQNLPAPTNNANYSVLVLET